MELMRVIYSHFNFFGGNKMKHCISLKDDVEKKLKAFKDKNKNIKIDVSGICNDAIKEFCNKGSSQ